MKQRTGTREEQTLAVAEEVSDLLLKHGVQSAVIGAAALAVHGHVRSTEDFDLATNTDPFTKLREVLTALREEGFEAEFNEPDADDPLGGVITITGSDFDPVQIVNFYNPIAIRSSPVGAAAVQEAKPALIPGSRLRVVDLPHLVALKLYAGGAKGRLDIIELLQRNQPVDIEGLRQICTRLGLKREFERLIAALGEP